MESLISYAEHTADGIVVHLEDGSCIRIDVDLKNYDTSAIKKRDLMIEAMQKRIENIECQCEILTHDNERLKDKLNGYKEIINDKDVTIGKLRNENSYLKCTNKSMEYDIAKLEKKIEELEKKLAEQEEECRELDSDEIKAALDEMNERVENVFSDANTLIDNASVIQDEVHYLRETLFGDEDDEDDLDWDDTEEYCPCCKAERLKKLADEAREKLEKGE